MHGRGKSVGHRGDALSQQQMFLDTRREVASGQAWDDKCDAATCAGLPRLLADQAARAAEQSVTSGSNQHQT